MRFTPKYYQAMTQLDDGRMMPSHGTATSVANFERRLLAHLNSSEFSSIGFQYTILEGSLFRELLVLLLPRYTHISTGKWTKWKHLAGK